MSDNILNTPQLDLSHTINLAEGIQSQLEENNKEFQRIAEEAYNSRQCMQNAVTQTAHNTANTNEKLEKVIDNQNDYINLLKEQLNAQTEQLDVLKNIFSVEENGINIETEIMNIIKGEIDSKHPLWEYVKDKGGDVAVAGVTAGIPIIYNAIKTYLLSKGLSF